MSENLDRGREHFRRRAWREAFESFSLAQADDGLEAEDLERLATAAYLIGRETVFRGALDRACRAHETAGEARRAARCAFWLGLMALLGGETGQASGWLAHARRLVSDRDCVEQGYLMVPAVEERLAARDAKGAFATAADVIEIGLRFEESDLIACARHLQGRALIHQERVEEGLSLFDEAMLAGIRDELSPIMTGLIYCSLIDACRGVFAFDRAREWTSALARWCDGQPQMVAFTGTCLLHRARIAQLQGDWSAAMAEVARARRRFALRDDAKPPAMAVYQQAELDRLRGRLQDAERGYLEASRMGWDPQPGLALLRLAQGRKDPARAGIQRALSPVTRPLERAKLLPACVEILLSTGDIEAARTASEELTATAGRFGTEVLEALAAHARGSVALFAGRTESALGSLSRASELWRHLDAPFEAARTRWLLGLACQAAGDSEAAELEFRAASASFKDLGARPVLPSATSLGKRNRDERPPLTPRELDVLRLVAAGLTNRAIAAELCISQRTIDRHVSNILTKLDVPSRAAATAFALRRNIL